MSIHSWNYILQFINLINSAGPWWGQRQRWIKWPSGKTWSGCEYCCLVLLRSGNRDKTSFSFLSNTGTIRASVVCIGGVWVKKKNPRWKKGLEKRVRRKPILASWWRQRPFCASMKPQEQKCVLVLMKRSIKTKNTFSFFDSSELYGLVLLSHLKVIFLNQFFSHVFQ